MSLLPNLVWIFSLGIILSGCLHTPGDGAGSNIYLVRSGDTLSHIAAITGAQAASIAAANKLIDPSQLQPGQELIIPGRMRIAPNSRTVTSVFGAAQKLLWPVSGAISSKFGMRKGRPHQGVDIVAPKGKLIRAAHDGKVIFSGWQRGYGRVVILTLGEKRSLYAHLSKSLLKTGQLVRQGDGVGLVGATGNARGYHLHFEFHINGKPVDPLRFYNPPTALSEL